MDNYNTHKDTENSAKEMMELFGFKSKLEEILYKADDSVSYKLTFNLLIVASTLSILFSGGNNLTTLTLLILIAFVISFCSSALNIWYLVRIKTRHSFLRNEQDRVFDKAKKNIVRVLELIKKIVAIETLGEIKSQTLTNEDLNKLFNKVKSKYDASFNASDITFMPYIIMDLALKETLLNYDKCMDSPLKEGYPSLKLFFDRLSYKTKTAGLVTSSFFLLAALVAKFVIS